MALSDGLVGDAGKMAQARVGQLLIWLSLFDGVLVVAVERGGIDDVERHLFGAIHEERLPFGPDIPGADLHLGAEMDAALRVVGELLPGIVVAGQ